MSYKTLLNGEIDGLLFYVEDSEGLESFGRKIAVKEIPNTSEQFAEDTGGFSPTFKLKIFWAGRDAQSSFKKFQAIANESGFKALTLPMLGKFSVKVGECKPVLLPNKTPDYICVDVEFYTSRKEAGFVEAQETLPSVLNAGEQARNSMLDRLADYSNKAVDFLSNATQKLDLQSMLNGVLELAGFAPNSALGGILSKIDIITGNADVLLNSGSLLANQLVGKDGLYSLLSNALLGSGSVNLINTIGRLSKDHVSTLQTQITAINDGVTGEAPVNFWDETTQTRIDRNEDRQTLADIHCVNLLIIAYEQYASTVYDTDEQADEAKREIEEAYLFLVHGQDNIVDGKQIVDSKAQTGRFLYDQAIIEPFENVRITSLKAAEGALVVNFKVETYNLRNPLGIYNAAYLSQSEQITNEKDLLDLARVMRNANGRKTYGVVGDLKVLRRVENV
jgi:hypothetical protein